MSEKSAQLRALAVKMRTRGFERAAAELELFARMLDEPIGFGFFDTGGGLYLVSRTKEAAAEQARGQAITPIYRLPDAP